MATGKPEIQHVSDTALWVAAYRARETERRDALFRDPLARELSGERGEAIARTMPATQIVEWVLIMRTLVIDRFIDRAIQEGADMVVNLGAGLDTRPYRMKLPPDLHWVEVDFPDMIAAKNEGLKSHQPRCRLERVAADLADPHARQETLARLASRARRAVVITEGVIFYLSGAEASALSDDLRAHTAFEWWIQDYRNGGIPKARPASWDRIFKSAPFRFNEEDWFGFFQRRGWKVEDSVTHATEAKRVDRRMPLPFLARALLKFAPREKRERLENSAGVVLFRR